jgi:hypothetical protein
MPEDKKFEKYLERRAEDLGLPTDPEAYQDGGLAVAATAFGVNEAELIAAMLRNNDIPAWVEGAGMASWYWHMQFAMHPAGIRVMVPTGRLADAQALLTQHRHEGAPAARPTAPSGTLAEAARVPAEEQPAGAEEPEDPAYPLYRRARGLAYLLFIGPLYPVIFVMVCILLFRIRRQQKQAGPTLYLTKARWIAMITLIYLLMCAISLGTVIAVGVYQEIAQQETLDPNEEIIIPAPTRPQAPKPNRYGIGVDSSHTSSWPH